MANRSSASIRRALLLVLAVIAVVAASCGTSLEIETATTNGDATAEPTAAIDADPTATEPEATEAPVDADPTAVPEADPTAAPEPDPTATPEPEPTATAEPDPTATPESSGGDVPDGFVAVDSDGLYSIAVPADWELLTDPDDVEALIELGSAAAGIDAAQLPALLEQMRQPGALFAIAPNGSNLNILSIGDIDVGLITPTLYESIVVGQFEESAGITNVEMTAANATYNGIDGLEARGSYELGGLQLLITQFIFEVDGVGYVASMTFEDGDGDIDKQIFSTLGI